MIYFNIKIKQTMMMKFLLKINVYKKLKKETMQKTKKMKITTTMILIHLQIMLRMMINNLL